MYLQRVVLILVNLIKKQNRQKRTSNPQNIIPSNVEFHRQIFLSLPKEIVETLRDSSSI